MTPFEDHVHKHLAALPKIHPTAYLSPQAYLSGDIEIGEQASIWPFASLRGDIAPIRIGAYSNVQDGAVLHVAEDTPAVVGEWVTIGHKAVVHACTVGNNVLIGMGAIILNEAHIADNCIIGANALITSNTKIPPGSLVIGSPAKIVRQLSDEEQKSIRIWADHYLVLSRNYRELNVKNLASPKAT